MRVCDKVYDQLSRPSGCVVFLALVVMGLGQIVFAVGTNVVTPPRFDVAVPPSTTNRVDGTQVELSDNSVKFTLFLPDGWTNANTSNITLCVAFHTAPAFTVHEHVRRGARDPLAVFSLGTGSSAYRVPFEDTNRFTRVIQIVEEELRRHGAAAAARIATVDVSSFSAGYGAVRELVKTTKYFDLIRRIILLDSLYGSLEPQTGVATNRVPSREHIDVWAPFARSAIRGEKTFVLTTSEVPTPTYASTSECAAALLARLDLKSEPTPQKAPTNTNAFVLLTRTDAGNFHVWSYSGPTDRPTWRMSVTWLRYGRRRSKVRPPGLRRNIILFHESLRQAHGHYHIEEGPIDLQHAGA